MAGYKINVGGQQCARSGRDDAGEFHQAAASVVLHSV